MLLNTPNEKIKQVRFDEVPEYVEFEYNQWITAIGMPIKANKDGWIVLDEINPSDDICFELWEPDDRENEFFKRTQKLILKNDLGECFECRFIQECKGDTGHYLIEFDSNDNAVFNSVSKSKFTHWKPVESY